MYAYIKFIEPVAIGDVGASESWSKDKHQHVEVIEVPGGGFYLRGKDGVVRRVPVTNVAYVQYTKDDSARVWAQAGKPK